MANASKGKKKKPKRKINSAPGQQNKDKSKIKTSSKQQKKDKSKKNAVWIRCHYLHF